MSDEIKDAAGEEAKILKAVKKVLTEVIKDTATQPGIKHPLSENTINGLRDCLVMIAGREQVLAEKLGLSNDMRPYFTDEPPKDKVVSIDHLKGSNKKR